MTTAVRSLVPIHNRQHPRENESVTYFFEDPKNKSIVFLMRLSICLLILIQISILLYGYIYAYNDSYSGDSLSVFDRSEQMLHQLQD